MSHLSNYIHQKYNAPPQLPVAISPSQIQNIARASHFPWSDLCQKLREHIKWNVSRWVGLSEHEQEHMLIMLCWDPLTCFNMF